MAQITIRGATTGRRAAPTFRPGIEQLEDRAVPATLLSSEPPSTTTGISPNSGLDASVQVLGTSADGNYVLIQSQATDFVPGQISPPGQTNLFLIDETSNQRYLVSGYDPAFFGTASTGTAVSKSLGVVPSITNPGTGQSAIYNAVISEGEPGTTGQVSVAFLSTANAYYYQKSLGNESVDGGGADVFVWSLATKSSTLASRTTAASGSVQALGGFGQVSNPSISSDGTSVAFLSTANITDVVTQQPFNLPPDLASLNNVVLNGVTANGVSLPQPVYGFQEDPSHTADLFRAAVGEDAQPVSYSTVFATASYSYTDDAGNPKVTTETVPLYFMDGHIKVDPLERYATLGEAGFAGIRTDLGDVYQFTYNPAQIAAVESGDVYTYQSSPSRVAYTELDGVTSPGVAGAGIADNAIISRESGDIFFTYKALSAAGNLISGYTNGNTGSYDLYQSQAGTGVLNNGRTVTLVSAAAGSSTRGANAVLDLDPRGYQATDDGTKVVFTSLATNLVSGLTDVNGAFDIFQRDMTTATTSAISVTQANPNATGNGESRFPTQTPDSLAIGYQSSATDLTSVPDANGGTDAFIRDMVAGDTLVASALTGNTSTGNAQSYGIVVARTSVLDSSFYRRFVAYFSSDATNLDDNNPALPATGQAYTESFPIFISQLSRVVSYSGGAGGFVAITTTDKNGNLDIINQFQPFPGYTGELRVATGDFNGDGTPDVIIGAGPGAGPRVKVIDGFTGHTLDDFFAYEPTFTGGVYVAAADMNGDGKADEIIGAGEGGGPRVQIYNSTTGVLMFDAFAFEATSRAGVRVAAGDVNGDGVNDLVVAAGNGGGPRVRVIDGTSLHSNGTILADFFAFETNARGGVYPAVGDYNGDGLADIAVGAGPGGGPRVAVYNAANLNGANPNVPTKFVDFYAFPVGSTSGARVAIRNINGSQYAGLVVGTASGLPIVRTFIGSATTANGGLVQDQQIIPFNSLSGTYGAYVG